MYCIHCQKPIDPSRGYFTMVIRGIRYDYHLNCRPCQIPN